MSIRWGIGKDKCKTRKRDECSPEAKPVIQRCIGVRKKRYASAAAMLRAPASQPSDLNGKLPQAVNLNAWPTTFTLGRDGRVRSVHAGFAGAASGPFHLQLKEEVNALVERLLAEK